MTVEGLLGEVCSSIELTETQRKKVVKRHNVLREKLRSELDLEDDFLTGSYARYTMIKPEGDGAKFDVDFFISFSGDDHSESELEDLKELVIEALEGIKEDDALIEDIQDQTRSVGVIYNDEFQIDVVPSIQIEKDKKYKIFDKKTKEAILSNPKKHKQRLTDANEASKSGSEKRLVPIVKLLKSWKQKNCKYIKSFHIELLAVELIGSSEISSFSEGLARFFTKAIDFLDNDKQLEDPANSDNIIDGYLTESQRGSFKNHLQIALDHAEKANQHSEAGEEEKALAEWRKVFSLPGKEEESVEIPYVISGGSGFKPHKLHCHDCY